MDSDAMLDNLFSFVSYPGRYKEAFPELYRLDKIAFALPVSTASCDYALNIKSTRLYIQFSSFYAM